MGDPLLDDLPYGLIDIYAPERGQIPGEQEVRIAGQQPVTVKEREAVRK